LGIDSASSSTVKLPQLVSKTIDDAVGALAVGA
jgi:hypothetical protein